MGRGEENSLVEVVSRQACEGARKEGVDAVLVSVYLRRPTRDPPTYAPHWLITNCAAFGKFAGLQAD